MKGDAKLITTLNSLLSDELTATNQYMVHAEICENWGYDKLHDHFKKRAIDEMKHAEMLIARIIFLEGMPVVNVLRKMSIGADIPRVCIDDLSPSVQRELANGIEMAEQMRVQVRAAESGLVLPGLVK